MKIRYLVTLTFVLIIIGAGLILNSVYKAEQRRFEASYKINLKLQTLALSNALEYLFSDYINNISYAASDLCKNELLPTKQNIEKATDFLVKTNRCIISASFIDTKGILKYTYPKKYSDAIGNNFSFRNYFKEVQKTNKIVISIPLDNYRPKNIELKYRGISIITPVFNNTKQRVGYLSIDIDIGRLGDLIQLDKSFAKKSHISYCLVDIKNKHFLYSPYHDSPKNLYINSRNFQDFLISFLSDRKERSTLINYGRHKIYVSSYFIDFKDSSLMVAAVLPYNKSTGHSANFSHLILLIIIFVLLILFLIAMIVIYNRIIVKKLEKEFTRLEIVIDEEIKKQNIEHITSDAFFKELSEKIKSIKQ